MYVCAREVIWHAGMCESLPQTKSKQVFCAEQPWGWKKEEIRMKKESTKGREPHVPSIQLVLLADHYVLHHFKLNAV